MVKQDDKQKQDLKQNLNQKPKQDLNKPVKVKMLKDMKAYDGLKLNEYKEGEEYDVSPKVAKNLESHSAIERLKAEEGDKYVQNQKVEGTEHEGGDDSLVDNEPLGDKAMSSKALKGAPSNKSGKKGE